MSRLAAAVEPCRAVLDAARRRGRLVIHTGAEGHRPAFRCAAGQGGARGAPSLRIGAAGAHGPHSESRGEPGHDIIAALYPAQGEPVIDKPGKGAFYQTELELMLRNRGIENLLVAESTTEVCVNTTVREANDRGYRCIVLADLLRLLFPALP